MARAVIVTLLPCTVVFADMTRVGVEGETVMFSMVVTVEYIVVVKVLTYTVVGLLVVEVFGRRELVIFNEAL